MPALAEPPPEAVPAASGTPILEARGVTRRFGGLVAVDDVSLRLAAGEIASIVGPNGAGKTTFFNVLTGQLRPSTGEVHLDGTAVTRRKPHQRARAGMGRTFQIVRPMVGLTVLENTMIGGFCTERRRRDARRLALATLERVELGHRADVLASELTLAERKRLEVARAVAGGPRVLLLDEVMAGLNPVETDRAVEMIRRLNREGLAVLLIEHNLKVVRALARHVVVLDHGAQIAEGTPDQVLDDPVVVEAYLGPRHAS